MKVVEVRSTMVNMPRREALATSYGSVDFERTVVVQVLTDEGITGVGQTELLSPFYGHTAEAAKVNIDKYLAPVLLGQDPLDIERLFILLNKSLSDGLYAITAVELALWDLKGKALGVPVYQLLGGKHNPGARLLPMVRRQDDVDAMVEQTEVWLAKGHTLIKYKIGLGVEEDLNWYARMREAVGDSVKFQVDANTGYTLAEALQVLLRMEQMGGLEAVEQPVRFLDEMVVLASRLSTPVLADELVVDPHSAYQIAKRDAAQIMLLKMPKHGGLLQVKRIAAVAEAAGLAVGPAIYSDFIALAAAHFGASTPNCTWPGGASNLVDSLLTEPFRAQGHFFVPPDRPGLGGELDPDKLAAYAVA